MTLIFVAVNDAVIVYLCEFAEFGIGFWDVNLTFLHQIKIKITGISPTSNNTCVKGKTMKSLSISF